MLQPGPRLLQPGLALNQACIDFIVLLLKVDLGKRCIELYNHQLGLGLVIDGLLELELREGEGRVGLCLSHLHLLGKLSALKVDLEFLSGKRNDEACYLGQQFRV